MINIKVIAVNAEDDNGHIVLYPERNYKGVNSKTKFLSIHLYFSLFDFVFMLHNFYSSFITSNKIL